MATKVTGSIVTYNNADIIEDCIGSVLQYTQNVDFTLYVIDNGSKDGTADLVEEKFASAYPSRVILIRNGENLGFGQGHNKVTETIDSEYHVVINPDITLHSEVVEELCKYLDEESDVAMVTPQVLNPDGSVQHLPKYCPSIRYAIISKFKPFRYIRRRYTRQDENLSRPTEVEFCTGCFFVIRTSIFKKLGGFDPGFFLYCEDADLSMRVRKEGKIIFYPTVSVTHLWKRENTGNMRGVFRFMGSLVRFFMKWGIRI
ncbi:MAG: glycosyltransferase family 2 protein [Lachnospiraceae bacterium]